MANFFHLLQGEKMEEQNLGSYGQNLWIDNVIISLVLFIAFLFGASDQPFLFLMLSIVFLINGILVYIFR